MDEIWKFLGTLDWAGVAIPVLAILVPTSIAVLLAQRERTAGREDRIEARVGAAKARSLRASEGVIVGLAHLVSADVMNTPVQERLGELRGRIAVYRAWIEPGDLSGDWLALQHGKGMRLFLTAIKEIDNDSGRGTGNYEEVFRLLDPARRWAQSTIDTFSGWLSGEVDVEVLRKQGAELLAEASA